MTKLLPFVFIKIGILKELQYRINFLIQLLQSIIAVIVGLFVLTIVFCYTTTLAGWNQSELVAVMGVQILMGGIITTIIQPNMLKMVNDVRQGTLDFILTKPADSQLLVSLREFQIWQLTDVLTGVIVFLWAINDLKDNLGLEQTIIFTGLLICGGLMIYSFWLILTTGAFWIVRMEEITELFQGIYAAGRWPVTIYPDWLRTGLTFIVPIAFAVTVPAEAITNRLTTDTMILTVVLTISLLIISRWFFKYGLKNYSSASS